MLEYSQELRRKGGESDDIETYLYLKLSSILVQVVHQSSLEEPPTRGFCVF